MFHIAAEFQLESLPVKAQIARPDEMGEENLRKVPGPGGGLRKGPES